MLDVAISERYFGQRANLELDPPPHAPVITPPFIEQIEAASSADCWVIKTTQKLNKTTAKLGANQTKKQLSEVHFITYLLRCTIEE